MYCAKCGAELADSEKKCPLCGTRAFHPDISRSHVERPYPLNKTSMSEDVNRSGVLFIITVLFTLPVAITLLCDWRINGWMCWSGYVTGAALLIYVTVILPLWFKAPNSVIFIPLDFAIAALYLFYINYATGGNWFLTFALPVTAASALIISAVVALLKYLRRGYLFVFGGATILSGALMVLVECLLNYTFHIRNELIWSFYPLTASLILGIMLIVIGICPPLKESLHKKFFI